MDTPLINGISYSWGNIVLVLFGVPVKGITEIEYTSKQKKENNYGAGTKAVSRGYGNEEFDASITLYREELARIKAAAPGKNIMKIPPFPIQIAWINETGQVDSVSLKACEFTELAFKAAQGDTSHKIKLPLIVADIQE